ncbi:hypothetical protein J6590_049585, partial [Homalodisca vitripennis]
MEVVHKPYRSVRLNPQVVPSPRIISEDVTTLCQIKKGPRSREKIVGFKKTLRHTCEYLYGTRAGGSVRVHEPIIHARPVAGAKAAMPKSVSIAAKSVTTRVPESLDTSTELPPAPAICATSY